MPEDPMMKTDYTTSSDALKRDVPTKPLIPEGKESFLETPPITVYTHNGKYSLSEEGNFKKNSDFSTPAEIYLKATMK
jgi:hypothetical protein